ncbi:MAG: hypothetical protein HEQ12_16175 [Aphanizomenon flos-aquae DEX188]|nr:MAG: hypothetical protein HEQ12_16175 [Aphanizomenon flos-aquae DEX188]
MSRSYSSSYPSKSMLTMFSYFSWAILGVLYFLFFSAKIPDLGQGGIEVRAGWYVIDRKDGTQAPSFQGGFMLKFGHSRLMALGDFKRTWRDDKTTCGVFQ